MSDNSKTVKAKKERPKGDVVITQEWCKGCGFCVDFCPFHVLELDTGINSRGYHPPIVVDKEKCTGCDLCGMYCPDFAIYGIKVNNHKKEK